MGCRTYSENLSALIDGELSPAESRDVRSHLAVCEPCRGEHESLLYAAETVDRLLEDRLEGPHWQLIRNELTSSQTRWNDLRWLFQPRWAAVAAVLLLLLFSVPFYWNATQPDALLAEQLVVYINERDRVEEIHRGIMDIEPVGWVTHNPFRVIDRDSENPFSLE